MEKKEEQIVIFSPKSGEVKLKIKLEKDTIWLTQAQISELFGIERSVTTKHLRNIFNTNELNRNSVSAKIAHTAADGKKYMTQFYNLDMIISVGYRVNSKKATQFRIWATKILKSHIVKGYTIDKKRVGHNYDKFIQAVADVKALLPAGNQVKARDVLDLINAFAGTWFSLDAYDTDSFPKKGITKRRVAFTTDELTQAFQELKHNLIKKKQATNIFGQERAKDAVGGIMGNVFQSFDKKDVYPTAEEKAAHILYFMVKDHPFVDGNKRSGAFAFVWFLRKASLLRASLTPEALTALTLLIAESVPKDKDKMIGIVLLLLRK